MPLPLRPTHAVVNLSQLRRNLQAIRAHVAPARVMVMLKANAYGHGLAQVAQFIAPGLDYIGVAVLDEAVFLRDLGVHQPILVAGGVLPADIPYYIEYGLTLTASSPEVLIAAEQAARKAGQRLKVHLKIDTGMERVGVRFPQAEDFLLQAASLKHIEVEGIYTHFANSDEADLAHAHLQVERFMEVLSVYEKRSLPLPELRHMANSGGVLNLPESHLDMVRPGLMFYGVYPHPREVHPVDVRPALTWKSRVAYSKVIPAGFPVSYGSLWQPETDSRVVTIPCGYADGYFRVMTNKASVIVNGRKYPQVGRICMDQFMVNLGDDSAALGDEVILLGQAERGEEIPAEDLAAWAGTNAYEVLTNISARVPRVYIKE